MPGPLTAATFWRQAPSPARASPSRQPHRRPGHTPEPRRPAGRHRLRQRQRFRNADGKTCVQLAFERMTAGGDVLDASSPASTSSSSTRGHERRIRRAAQRGRHRPAGFLGHARTPPTGRGRGRLEGVRTPSLVAKAVMDNTDITCWSPPAPSSSLGNWASPSSPTSTRSAPARCGSSGSAGSTRSLARPETAAGGGAARGAADGPRRPDRPDHFYGTINCDG